MNRRKSFFRLQIDSIGCVNDRQVLSGCVVVVVDVEKITHL